MFFTLLDHRPETKLSRTNGQDPASFLGYRSVEYEILSVYSDPTILYQKEGRSVVSDQKDQKVEVRFDVRVRSSCGDFN